VHINYQSKRLLFGGAIHNEEKRILPADRSSLFLSYTGGFRPITILSYDENRLERFRHEATALSLFFPFCFLWRALLRKAR
jgi:hypothetical protein